MLLVVVALLIPVFVHLLSSPLIFAIVVLLPPFLLVSLPMPSSSPSPHVIIAVVGGSLYPCIAARLDGRAQSIAWSDGQAQQRCSILGAVPQTAFRDHMRECMQCVCWLQVHRQSGRRA